MLSRRHCLSGLSGLLLPQMAQAKDALRIPLKFNASGLPHVAVSFGGKGPYRFVVDSGASVNGVNVRLAPELGLMARTKARISGAGGSEITPVYLVRDIAINATHLYDELIFIGLRNPPFAGAAGMLGASFVAGRPTELDFDRAELRISEDAALSAYQMLSSRRLSPGSSDHRVMVDVTLDGMALKLLIDTGASAEVSLNSACVQRLNLWDRYPVLASGHTVDINSTRVQRRTVKVPDFRLGAFTIAATPVSLAPPGVQRSDASDGVIGMRTLRRFGLCFDGTGGVGLKTRNDAKTLPYLWEFKPKSP
jgi:predicted aspartyl protease